MGGGETLGGCFRVGGEWRAKKKLLEIVKLIIFEPFDYNEAI